MVLPFLMFFINSTIAAFLTEFQDGFQMKKFLLNLKKILKDSIFHFPGFYLVKLAMLARKEIFANYKKELFTSIAAKVKFSEDSDYEPLGEKELKRRFRFTAEECEIYEEALISKIRNIDDKLKQLKFDDFDPVEKDIFNFKKKKFNNTINPEEIKDFHDRKNGLHLKSKLQKNKIIKIIIDQKEKSEKEVVDIESENQNFAIYKVVFEDVPQVILQLSVLLRLGRISEWFMTIIFTLCLNLFATIWSLTNAYLKMPLAGQKENRISVYRHKLNIPIVFIFMAVIVSPRLALISVWFTNSAWWSLIVLPLALVTYGLTGLFISQMKLQRTFLTDFGYRKIGWYSALYGPCVIGDPNKGFYKWTSAISLGFHLFFSILFIILIRLVPNELINDCANFYSQNGLDFTIMTMLIVSFFCSWFLDYFSTEDGRQLFGLKLGLSLSCDADKQFFWAYRKAFKDGNGQKNKFDPVLEKYAEMDDENVLNSRDKFGRSVFHIACSKADGKRVKKFLEWTKVKNIDVNVQDRHGHSGLHRACKERHMDIVELLLGDANIKVNSFDIKGENAFHMCKTFCSDLWRYRRVPVLP